MIIFAILLTKVVTFDQLHIINLHKKVIYKLFIFMSINIFRA